MPAYERSWFIRASKLPTIGNEFPLSTTDKRDSRDQIAPKEGRIECCNSTKFMSRRMSETGFSYRASKNKLSLKQVSFNLQTANSLNKYERRGGNCFRVNEAGISNFIYRRTRVPGDGITRGRGVLRARFKGTISNRVYIERIYRYLLNYR